MGTHLEVSMIHSDSFCFRQELSAQALMLSLTTFANLNTFPIRGAHGDVGKQKRRRNTAVGRRFVRQMILAAPQVVRRLRPETFSRDGSSITQEPCFHKHRLYKKTKC